MIHAILALWTSLMGVKTAQIQPCSWPNRCAAEPAPIVAQIQPCSWPNRCAVEAPVVLS